VNGKTPPNYWATMIALAALALTGLNMILDANRGTEQRLCRLEVILSKGDCGK
jgi:hypothetical protein